MVATIGRIVHPWYKGSHEWLVEGIAELSWPMEYNDPNQGHVQYAPKILSLRNSKGEKPLWFAYWISTDKTKGRLKWGGGPPMLEEGILLDLLKEAIKQGFFTENFLRELKRELSRATLT
jgi:hypothetical protein